MIDEKRDILSPLGERGKFDSDHIQSVVEVFAEFSAGDEVCEFSVGCRNHAHVYLNRLRRAQGLEGPLLEDAQQLHLKRHCKITYFIEENGAAVRQVKPAGLIGSRVGERTLSVAEQFGFEESFWEGSAIDFHIGLIFAGAEVVDRPGEEFLSRAARTLDQHRAGAFGHVGKYREDFLDFLVLADDVAEGVLAEELPAKLFHSGEVAKRLGAPHDLVRFVTEHCGGHVYGYFPSVLGENGRSSIYDLLSAFHALVKRASSFAYVGSEDVETVLPNCFFPGEACDLLRGTVERSDPSLEVNGEHAVRDGIENLLEQGFVHCN